MKHTLTLLAALLLASLAPLHAADTPKPAVKVTQELLNSIHVTPKLIFDPMPAYGQKHLPFAMAASMESTKKGRLWTCWAGGEDGPNAYSLGRSAQLSDQPLIDKLTKTEGGHVGKMIEQIVLSPQFREIRGRDSISRNSQR